MRWIQCNRVVACAAVVVLTMSAVGPAWADGFGHGGNWQQQQARAYREQAVWYGQAGMNPDGAWFADSYGYGGHGDSRRADISAQIERLARYMALECARDPAQCPEHR